MIYKIIIISSGQPSLNPRLVKEADALALAGHEVTVLYAYWNSWGTRHDELLLPSKKWRAVRVAGSPDEHQFTYLLSRCIHRSACWFQQITGSYRLAELTVSRSAFWLKKAARTYRADFYIGHNLGALAATVSAAKYHHKPCGFDAEDFHRYEVSDNSDSQHFKVAATLENKYLTKVDYLTTSSPQTSSAYHGLFPFLEPVTLLNVFPKVSVKKQSLKSGEKIRLFWFSQTIGPRRGIETLIKALVKLGGHPFELHLLGEVSPAYQFQLVQDSGGLFKLCFYPPIAPEEIVAFASQFDIGLAMEPGFSINNDFALSNKLFTYLQAGLAILASDTTAQKFFFSQYCDVGRLYHKDSVQSLISALSYFAVFRQELNDMGAAALKLGREKLNWEQESNFFLTLVTQILDKHWQKKS